MENSNVSEARVSFDDNQTAVSVNNNAKNTILDPTDNLKALNVLKIGETAENGYISITRITSNDKQTSVSVNNYKIEFKNDMNKDTSISEDIRPSDGNETAVQLNNNTNKTTMIDEVDYPYSNNVQNSRNVLKIGETTENSNIITKDIIASDEKQTAVSINNANHTTVDNRHNSNCNKRLNPQNKPDIVPNISTENINNELAVINDNTEETTTECIREFEEILANVENELTLDSEITLDDVDDLINDFRFDSYDEIHISDTESQIPIHIVRKNVEKHMPTDFVDFTYNKKVESVDLNKPNNYPVELYNTDTIPTQTELNNSKGDAKINITVATDVNVNITANNYNTIVTDVNLNTNANDGNTKPDFIISTIANSASTNKTENYDTISLSSDDNIIDSICISDSSDSDCGYHSSDFEFITEEEAKRDGLIINLRPDNLKNRDLNAKPDSRQPKTRKITSRGKNVQPGPSRTLKMPTNNGKNDQAGSIIPVRKRLHIQARLSNPVKMPSIFQAGPSNPVQVPLNIEARPSNSAQRPSNVQAGPSNVLQRPSNVQGPSDSFQRPSNVHLGTINPVQRPSHVQARPRNSVQMPSIVQAGPSNSAQRPLNIEAGPSNPVPIPSNVHAGPSNPVPIPSNVHAGPSNPVPIPSNVHAGPSNPVPIPSNVQAGPSNPVPIPSNVEVGPSNPVPIASNCQLIPNYESYRNRYKKPFKYDTAYRNHHIEPQGDGYIDLFRGFHAGLYSMYTRENKSVTPNFANPRVKYRGVGFDMQMMRGNSSDDEDDGTKEEANKTLQKIRSEYSMENRKRRH